MLKYSPLPRAMSIARLSRFSDTKMLILSLDAMLEKRWQFEVPEVMPKVWFANVPFVVTASVWEMRPLFPWKMTEPSPHPVLD